MELNELFATLPRGKGDKPILLPTDDLVFDPDNIDGRYFTLDPAASGCVVLMFSKPMDPAVPGRASLDGQPLPRCILQSMPQMGGLWVAGIGLRGFATEHGKVYNLHVEGFTDTDGNEMNPQDFAISVPAMQEPKSEYAAHEEIALRCAREGIVLLKNNGVLPLSQGIVLNLFGKGIYRFRTSAAGAGEINPRYRVNFLTAIRADSHFALNRELADFYRYDLDLIPDDGILTRAKAWSETAVMLIERGARENRENCSAKGEYYLTDEEEALLKKLRDTFAHLVVILNVGYPMDVTFAEKYDVDAVLYNGFGGMLAGKALCDVLSGRENPCGKLPDTWAKDYFDIPASRNFYDSPMRIYGDDDVYVDTIYEEGIYVGYRYFHTFGKECAYPFGYGLSYTTFDIQSSEVSFDGKLKLTVTVTNTGKAAGREVVQLYVRKPETLCETPERELVWFGKTKLLAPGESEVLTANVEPKFLAVFDTNWAAWVMPAGNYKVFAGGDSLAPECGSFHTEEILVQQAEHLMLPVFAPEELRKANPDSFPKGKRSGVKAEKGFTPAAQRKNYEEKFDAQSCDRKLTYADVKAEPALLNAFVSQLSVEELARLSVGANQGWSVATVGEAGRIYRVEGRELPDFPMADGNSGVNLRTPNIGMPTGTTMAATFDKELMEDIGRVIGEEARELGIPLILAPGINLHRNPLCGRHPEYFSEDPYLAGVMAGLYCRGMESAGVGSCIKHLTANNCETSRKRNQSIIGERALRELYLRPFQIAMGVHQPASVMTSYNAVNGCSTAADEELIQGFLRSENGFDGFVMTDWDSYHTMNVADAVEAGNCWMTPGTMDDTYVTPIVEGVKSGRIRLDRLRENAAYIIKTMLRFAR